MTIASELTNATKPVVPCAVAWISDEWASLAQLGVDGEISTTAIHRGAGTEAAYLELIAGVVGRAQRVLVMGPSSMRLALERAYVALYRWPERLVDVEHADALSEEELIDRLRQLAGAIEG